MRKLVRALSVVLVIANLLFTPLSAFAATAGPGSTSSDNMLLSKWKGYGVLDGTFTNSDLSKPVQKIDFIKIVNNLLNATKQAKVSFNDVPEDSWYGQEIAKAVAAGYLSDQDKTNYEPFSNMSRLDAAIMAASAFELELKDKSVTDRIKDAEKLDESQLAAFGAVIEKGALTEVSDGRYVPMGVLKLGDALKMLDKCVGQFVTKSTTISTNVAGNMLINAGSVNLKNMTINGDLVIGDGNVKLDTVTVKGRLIVRGSGSDGLSLKNTQIPDEMIVEQAGGAAKIELSGTSAVEKTTLRSGAVLSEINLSSGKGFSKVSAEHSVLDNEVVTLKGNFDDITISESNIDVKFTGNAESVSISKDSESDLSVNGNVKAITTKASKGTIELLGGTTSQLTVDTGAKGNRIDISGANATAIDIKETAAVNLNKGTVGKLTFETTAVGSNMNMKDGAVLNNFYANAGVAVAGQGRIYNAYVYSNDVSMGIKPSGTYFVNGQSTNIDGSVASSNPSQIKVYGNDKTIQKGKTEKVNAFAFPSDAILSYSSSDKTIATVDDKGMLTANSTGKTTVHISAKKDGYQPNVATINVTVTSDNITASGTLAITPAMGEAGKTNDFTLTYTAGDNMSNGTVVIRLPAGFTALDTDTVVIGNSAERALGSSQGPSTLVFGNLNLANGQTIVVKLKNKIIPASGQYEFSAVSDADGSGPKLPTAGDEKVIFTSDSMRTLVEGINYSKPEYGSTGGTIKIATLSFIGIENFTNDYKWLISVQSGAITPPKYNDNITGTTYQQGQDITAAVGQNLLLAAVDASGMVKGYAIIAITDSMIRPYDAGELVAGTNYNTPSTGIQANTTRIDGLNYSGADHWMIKVQDTALTSVFVNTKFTGTAYTGGNDIKVNAGQHILLAAVDSKDNVLAYKDITITPDMVSTGAGVLLPGNNYTVPSFGPDEGSTMISSLNKGDAVGGFTAITKWMTAIIDNAAVVPAKNATTDDYSKYYLSGKSFSGYTEKAAIFANAGQHLILVGVDDSNRIQAYADIKIDQSYIRQADAPAIPDGNYSAPQMGSTAGTTMINTLNFSTAITGAVKYMVKVQDGAAGVLQVNSILSGAVDYNAKQDVGITAGQHLILVATDASGKIKAYKDLTVVDSQIRPKDAFKLSVEENDYSAPEQGSADGSTKIVLNSANIPRDKVTDTRKFAKWVYLIQGTKFAIPYDGSDVPSGVTEYTSGTDIKKEFISAGQYILILAVDTNNKVMAYTQELITAKQIRQAKATELIKPDNYTDPVAGLVKNTTRIMSLNLMGISGATKWVYQVTNTAVSAPDYNSAVSGSLYQYIEGQGGASITIAKGQYIVLYAVDGDNRVKAYKNIQVTSDSQIKTEVTLLKAGYNYTVAQGSVQGTTVFSALSFVDLAGQDPATWKWQYAISDKAFIAPAVNTAIGSLGYTTSGYIYDTVNKKYPDLTVKAGQYILLLAVDSSNIIQGYANIQIVKDQIKPAPADIISPANYSLVKGTVEGTTRFDTLTRIGLSSEAKKWMIKKQSGSFNTDTNPIPRDTRVDGADDYNDTLKNNITVAPGDHILLLATDTYGYVKAYCDITVTKDQIQNPFATELVLNNNYTNPQPGISPGAISLILKSTGIPTEDTIVWKYKIGTTQFSVPHLDDIAGAEYQSYTSNADIQAKANDYLLVVAVNQSDSKIKAYKQFKITESQIKPAEAALLEEGAGNNYTAPVPGSDPGTTKIGNLSTIGLSSEVSKWQVKVFDDPQVLLLNSVITYPTSVNYTGGNIAVKEGQYVVLAAVDTTGKVKAYACIKIAKEQINAPLAAELLLNTNYSSPKYGLNKGTTTIKVSPDSATYVLKVTDAGEFITAGQVITVNSTLTGSDYSAYRKYVSNTDIAAKEGQYIVLVAIDSGNKALAFKNIPIGSAVNPGQAVILTESNNYTLQPGAGAGTTRFTDLDYIGVDIGDTTTAKWVYKVQNTAAPTPLINTSVEGAAVVTVNQDITVNEGQYILLYALNGQNLIKGFACIEVKSGSVKGVASLLQIDSQPVPGSLLSTMKLDAAVLTPVLSTVTSATQWRYIVQDAAAGTVLKDSVLSGAVVYTPGSDIAATAGKHLILAATDASGLVKAYADITVTNQMLKNVTVTLSGTIITVPTGESDIAAGGRTIIIKLDSGEWQDDIITNQTRRNMLYSGFKASGTEATKWDTNVIANSLIKAGASAATLTDSKTVTIVLSQAVYDITQNQQVTFTVNKDLVKNAVLDVTSSNIIKIAANVVVQPLGGTAVTQGLNQNDVATGGKTIIITLSNGEFAQDVASDTDKRNAIFDGFKTSNSVTTMWDKVVAALKSAADSGAAVINRNAPNVLTINLPPVSGYVLSTNELISVTLPYKTSTGKEILVGAIKDAVAPAPFTISANTVASLSGTLLSAPVSEADIAAGGKTLVITLTDGQWATDIATDKMKREALFTGLKLNGTTDASQWNNVVAALKTASALTGQTTIVRNSDSIVTIKLPVVATYKITANQTVTLNIPATSIMGGKNTVTAGQDIIVERLGTAALSGTVSGAAEGTIRAGGKTIIITLTKATWADDVVSDTVKRNALLNGFKADSETSVWNLVIDGVKNADGSVQRTSDTVVTITLPPVSGYDIAANQMISITVPTTCAAIGTSFDIKGTNKLTINNAVTPATVTKVAAVTSGTAYKAGDTVDINVVFDNAVDVTGSGKPTIKLETGSTDRTATYDSGSGTNTLLFKYTVQAGDINPVLDYVAGTTIVVPSGTTVVNKGTTTSVNKTLPAVGAGSSLSASNILIDGVAPVFATGSPAVGNKTETEANFTAKIGEAGNLYYVVLPDSATAPSTAQIKLKQDSAGNTAAVSGEVSLQANIDAAFKVSGLTAYTSYIIYMVPADTIGNTGDLKTLSFKTPDLTAPGFVKIPEQVTPISDNKIDILLSTTEDATVYMIALPKDSAAPTSAQVKEFKDAAGNVVTAANLKLSKAVKKGVDNTLSLTGLSSSSHYDIYAVCVDASNNITTDPAIVMDAKTAQLNLDIADVDLAKNTLLNTTAGMEYSLDGLNWKTCSASTTSGVNYTYTDSDIKIYVYLRDIKDRDNNTRTIELTREDSAVIDRTMISYNIADGEIVNNSPLNLQYRIGGGDWKALNARATATSVAFVPGYLDLRTAATSPTAAGGDSKMPSDPKTVDSIPEKAVAPTLTYNDTTNTIDSLSAIYQYRIGEGTWQNGLTTGDFSGTKKVSVRFAATATQLPSNEQVIQFTANVIKVVASPDAVTTAKLVTITFEENTNKAAQTITAQQIKDWFTIKDASGTAHEWGTDLQGKFNATGNILTITFSSMAVSTVEIGDIVTVTPAANIQNPDGSSGAYTSVGTLTGSFHTVPKIVSIKAENTNNNIGFTNGEKLVITFDQDTNQKAISAANIAANLILTDATGSITKHWSKSGTPKVTLTWVDKKTLAIVFNDVTDTDIAVGDKIRVNTAWGLKDFDNTTAPCSSTMVVTGSFTTTPQVLNISVANGGVAGVVDANDTITITFDQATNKPKTTAVALVSYFKLVSSDGSTAHSWGVQNDSNITWNTDGSVLKIKLTNMSGVTVKANDKLSILSGAAIMAAGGGTANCQASGVSIGTGF
jgi:hypothetical protein